MGKRVVKILASLILVILVAVPGAALMVDDETLSDLLQAIPGVAGSTDLIIARKQSMASTLTQERYLEQMRMSQLQKECTVPIRAASIRTSWPGWT